MSGRLRVGQGTDAHRLVPGRPLVLGGVPIEYERGLLSKRIDVIQLWRVRDVVYKQNLVDRILSIAHIQVVASDATNPNFDILGMPASRKLFEQLRDSIEIQRQAKNVYGVVS